MRITSRDIVTAILLTIASSALARGANTSTLVEAAQAVRESRATRPRILGIDASDTAEGLVITLQISGAFTARPIEESPGLTPSLSLDLPGVLPGAASSVAVSRGSLSRVRVFIRSADPLITRVVFELTRRVTYRVAVRQNKVDKQEFAVTFDDRLAAKKTAAGLALVPVPISSPRPTAPKGPRPWGRASLYMNSASMRTVEGTGSSYSELISSVTYQMPDSDANGAEYGLDLRHSAYTIQGRDPRLSVYDGFVGARLGGGKVRVRAGHMWLNDLGALGSVAGALLEIRAAPAEPSARGRLRFGVFGGLEPNVFTTGYANNVRKLGGYFGIDGAHNRRHVVGYVNVKNADVTERSVVTTTTFVPVGTKVFLYQAAEYDISGPAGQGQGGLTYLFSNARYSPASRLELQGSYNRGRSLDVRGVSEDVLNGRPVTVQAIEGLRDESIGGRVTVEVLPRIRAYAGYAQDKNNRDDAATGRWLVGGYASNIAQTGIDLAASDSRIDRPTGNYHSSYFSVGRQIGRRVYVSGDYTTSLSLVRFTRSDGLIVETRPHTVQFGGSGVVNLGRVISLLITAGQTVDDEVDEFRMLSGITFRFQ